MRGFSHENKKTANDTWLTPLWIVNSLGCFDMDPCGRSNHQTAKRVISLPENGLKSEWSGRVWLNPPYSEVEPWVNRLAHHGSGVALVFARTETKWAQGILPRADSVFFPKGRLRFLRADLTEGDQATAPSMFLSFGERPNWLSIMPGWIAK